jgi:inosine/xanthosine triphosphatase
MKIHVGSKNAIKIAGVVSAVSLYPDFFIDPVILGIEVSIPEFGHPKSLDAIFEGARARAIEAFVGADFSVGVESGLVPCRYLETGYLEVQGCVVYDGTRFSSGTSTGFEWPPAVLEKILTDNFDGSSAMKELGFYEGEKIGAQEGGIIARFTGGRKKREEQIIESFIMAMIPFEQKAYYQRAL